MYSFFRNLTQFHFLSALIIILSLQVNCIAQDTLKTIDIGIIYDAELYQQSKFIDILKKEVPAVMGASYKVNFPDEYQLVSHWDAEKAVENYKKLESDPKIDVVICLGALGSTIAIENKVFSKPTFLWGVIDPEEQNVQVTENGSTGINNLSYVQTSSSLKTDLIAFHEATKFKKIAVFIDDYIYKLYSPQKPLDAIINKLDADFSIFGVDNDIDVLLSSIDSTYDAVYSSYLFKLNDEKKALLFHELAERGIAVFTAEGEEGVKNGALIGLKTEDKFNIIARRFALNIEGLFEEGKNASELPVVVHFEEKIVLNAKTANTLKFLPKWDVIFNAEWVDAKPSEDDELSLENVIDEAVASNMNYKASEYATLSGNELKKVAGAALMPTINASVNGAWIDQPTAERSFGSRSERQLTGTLELQQVIYSEKVFTNARVQKYLQEARESGNEQVMLDVVYQASVAYYNLLYTKTQVKIARRYLESTKRNLEISQLRENVGYSGNSDVYRWKSNLAQAEQRVIDANLSERQQMLVLNNVLNRNMKEEIFVKDVELTDGIYAGLASNGMASLVNDPISLLIISDYIVDKALTQRPIVMQYASQMLALQRQQSSDSRNRFIPEVALQGGYNRYLARGGAGTGSLTIPGQSTSLDPLDQNWNVAVVATIPLFSGFTKSRQYQKTKFDKLQLEAQQQQTMLDVEQEVRVAVLDLASTSTNITNSREAMEAAQKNYDIVRDNYSKGRVSIIELIDAQNNAFESEQNASNAVYKFLQSSMKMQRAVGEFSLLKTDEERDITEKEVQEIFENQRK
ncbi:TolC family protein [Flammeovirga kamogawensis]|uniref:TolC family protein n=1 Tax=Flammeovirga kamogawensis TaxID=373891 RepID=A0ABX8H0I1_9BACT|nr:TolC family protein [Flammeovirga kamogawensis]MBB6462276.1 outer membrane protein TolC [Flammeovirga kamogawensis]QWG09330.1 TolC family protein [Flammeovirga kamogawensis]TRX64852.1 TolC family protein [Flammeovirga kamogawensis]